jgi:hypothetical protein
VILLRGEDCSMRERILDFALLARRVASGIARPFGFLR